MIYLKKKLFIVIGVGPVFTANWYRFMPLLKFYMAMGGIPQYLKQVEVGESSVQAIDRICFTRNGLLNHEFKDLDFSQTSWEKSPSGRSR